MAAAVREAAAGSQRELVLRVVVRLVLAVLVVSLHPGELLVEDEVDHTAHGAGAVRRRGTAGGDVDTGDQGLRNGVDIDQTLDGGRHPALAVHQYQSARGSEVAQVQGSNARFAVGERAGGVIHRGAPGQRRQRHREVNNVGGRRGLQGGGADGRYRLRRVIVGAADVRAGD